MSFSSQNSKQLGEVRHHPPRPKRSDRQAVSPNRQSRTPRTGKFGAAGD